MGQLDGVVITGGEPFIHKNLAGLVGLIKSMGYAVKIDTNGYFPARLQALLEDNLIDYVAMDIKAPFTKYAAITRITPDINRLKQSIRCIMSGTAAYEFRITLVEPITNSDDMENIAQCIEGAALVYLQKSTFPEKCTLSENELIRFKQILEQYVVQCRIR